MATERVNIVVTERGTRVVKRRLAGVGTTSARAAKGVNLLQGALAAIGSGVATRELLRMADTFTLMQNRLKLVTTGTQNLADVTKQLLQISNDTRTSFQGNAELYARVARSTEELGVSQKQLLQFTKSLNQAIIVSGASAQEASAGLIQLSQGLASGALRGDELRSVMEQLPYVAKIIADEMGIGIGKFRELAQEGAISADIVLRAFKNAQAQIEGEFSQTVATLGQSFTVLRNQVVDFVGRLDASTGITRKISKAIMFLSENVETIAKLLGPAVFTAAAIGATTAVTALTAAIMANPLGALAVGITYVIGLLVTFRNDIKLSQDGIVSLGDFAAAAWERISAGATKLFDLLRSALPDISGLWKKLFGDLDLSFEGFLKGAARVLDWHIGLWKASINVIKALWKGFWPAILDLTIQAMNRIITTVENAINRILKAFASLAVKLPGRFGEAFEGLTEGIILGRVVNVAGDSAQKLGEEIRQGLADGMASSTGFEDAVNGLFDRARVIAKDRMAKEQLENAGAPTAPTGDDAPTSQGQSRALKLLNSNIQEQIELLRMSAAAREIETQVRKKGAALLPAEQAAYRTELERLQVVKQVSGVLDTVRGSEVNLAAAQAELNRQVEAGTISLQQATEAYRLLESEALSTQTSLSAGWERGFNSVRETVTDLATQAENTLVNAFNSAEDALVDFVTTGKVDFKSMVDSILGDLTRLIARMLIVKALEKASGGGGPIGALASAFGGGKASGGGVTPGEFYEVGERGRELFAPDVPGKIISNPDIANAVSSEQGRGGDSDGDGGLVIINVSSREEALAAMGSTEGKRVILNVMSESERATI